VRSENQDAIALLENTSRERMILVADGMGGHRGGETASKICVQLVERVFREPHGAPNERLQRGLDLANEEIYSHALANPELRGMGSTVVVALIAPGGRAWLAWVGDSRCYRLRAGALERLTRDHSLMSEWISIGVITEEAAETHPRRHELTRALGQSPDVPVDLVALELHPGDRLLLCSDGLHGCVNDRALKPLLEHGAPQEVTRALVDAANAAGGADNVSVVVVVVPEALAPAPAIELPHDFELVPVLALAPEIEPAPDLTADIAAELTLEPSPSPEPILPTTPEPAPALTEEPAFDGNAEISFADLDAEVAEVVTEPTLAQPEVAEQAEALDMATVLPAEPEPEFLLPSEQRIQIPLMTPVRAKRGLDTTSVMAGVAATLAIVGLGFGFWLYTRSGQVPETAAVARPAPAIVRVPTSKPTPTLTPALAAQPVAEPAAAPKAKPVAKVEPAPTPAAAPLQKPVPAISVRAATQGPALEASGGRNPANAPASPEPSAAEAPPTARGFELEPDVERFVDGWLRALATHDRVGLAALGFADEPSAFAGMPGSRDGFRLVAADVDEERSQAGRVYLRMVVSYAFRDATGRFRTQDEQRLILRSVGGQLRFEGRWQQ